MELGNRMVLLALTRIANYGVILLSPLVLVRLLTVEEFGRYREFLLYAGILQTIAAFGISESLLYFVAAHPQSPWRVARHSAALTFMTSFIVTGALLLIDGLTHGRLVGPYRWPLAASTLFAANLDFWEWFWVARGRAVAVFLYSAGRLVARLAGVITAAALTHDVSIIIWTFVAVEGGRLLISAIMLRSLDASARESALAHPWREFIGFCVPSGLATVLWMVNSTVSNIAVVRLIGAAALAQYAIGRFGEPVVITLRNSISTVLLPEMVRRGRMAREGSLALWRQANVTNALVLFPVVVLVTRFAHELVVTLFGAAYAQAAVVMQLYMLVVVRECFDFASALRAAGHARPMAFSNSASLLACIAALGALVPAFGVVGAMASVAIASYVDAAWLAWATVRTYGIPARALLPWSGLGKTTLAAVLPGILLFGVPAGPRMDVADILAAALYLGLFALISLALRIREAWVLLEWAKRNIAVRLARRA